MKSIIVYFFLFIVMLDNIFLPFNIGFDLRLNLLIFPLFSLFFLISKPILSKINTFLAFFFKILLIIVISLLLNIKDIPSNLKGLFLLSINFFSFYTFLNYTNFDLKYIINKYINICFLFGLIGLFQTISIIVNFKYGYNFSYLGLDMGNIQPNLVRLQSFFQEPSFYCYVVSIPFNIVVLDFFNLSSIKFSKIKKIVIFITYILTFSSAGIIGFLLLLIYIAVIKYFKFIKLYYLLIFIPILFSILFLLYSNKLIKTRVTDSYKLFFTSNETYKDISKTNLSTYALYSNSKIVKQSIKNEPFFGNSFFSYEKAYYKYFDYIPNNHFKYRYTLNSNDGNSLAFRLVVELGLIGFFTFLAFIFISKIKYIPITNELNYLWVINISIFFLILIRLIRQGHYTSQGFIFFILIFIYSHYFYKKSLNV